jgi:hypothetical protein
VPHHADDCIHQRDIANQALAETMKALIIFTLAMFAITLNVCAVALIDMAEALIQAGQMATSKARSM